MAEAFCHIYSYQSAQLALEQLTLDKYNIEKNEEQAKKMSAYLLIPEMFMGMIYDAAIDETVLISDLADYFVVTEEFAQYRLKFTFNRSIGALYVLRGKLGTLEWYE